MRTRPKLSLFAAAAALPLTLAACGAEPAGEDDDDGADGAELHGDAERSADDNALVSCTAGSKYAIGFFGFAYLKANEDKLQAVKVDGVGPSFETIADGSYSPLSRPIFMVTDGVPAEGTILHDYFSYAFHPEGGQALVETVGYVALDPAKLHEMQDQIGHDHS